MAYKNIVWVKLERRLLNDYRWYQMSYYAQLLYIKLILFAAETYNKIPKLTLTLMSALRMELEIGQFNCALEEVKRNFPKFKSNKHFYYFDEFEHKTNFLPDKELLSNRSAIAQHSVEKKRKEKEKKREEKIREDKGPAAEIYSYYSKTIKAGAQEDAIHNINRLLTKEGFTKEDLVGRIDAYKAHLIKNPTEPRFYIQANNFFGKAARYKDYAPIRKVEYLPPDKNCKVCGGQGKLQNGEGQIQRCFCVKEKS